MKNDINTKILIVEDEASWRNRVSVLLRREGFTVHTAANLEEAKKRFSTDVYHLVITDLELEVNEENYGGLSLLSYLEKEVISSVVNVIALSGKLQNPRVVRDTAQRVSTFLFKSDYGADNDKLQNDLLIAIKEALASVRTQAELVFSDRVTLESLIQPLRFSDESITNQHQLTQRVREQLPDLFGKLYPDASKIRFVLFTHSGHSGTGIVLARGIYSEGTAPFTILKYGERQKLVAERDAYVRFAKFIQQKPELRAFAETRDLGAIVYSFLNTHEDNDIRDFSDFFAEQSIEQVNQFLDHLFRETCGNWYAQPRQWQTRNLSTLYCKYHRITTDNIRQAWDERLLGKLEKERQKDSATTDTISPHNGNWKQLDIYCEGELYTLPNPAQFQIESEFVHETAFCITHGDLNIYNIIVGKGNSAWLIDFLRAGTEHCLRDFVALEVSIKYDAMQNNLIPLKQHLEFETNLALATTYREYDNIDFTARNALDNKYFKTILLLRRHAEAVSFPRGTPLEYNIALFYASLSILRYYESISDEAKIRALISAGILGKVLGITPLE